MRKMKPKKYKALSIYGNEVIGYPAPIVIDLQKQSGEVKFLWGIYTEDCIYGRTVYASNEKEVYKVNSIPIYIDTLKEVEE